jgi:hypothetical protein
MTYSKMKHGITTLSIDHCYVESSYFKCPIFIVMLIGNVLNVINLSVVMLNIILTSKVVSNKF